MEGFGAEAVLRCNREDHVHRAPGWSAAAAKRLVEVGEGLRLLHENHEALLVEVDADGLLGCGDNHSRGNIQALHALVHGDLIVSVHLAIKVKDDLPLFILIKNVHGTGSEDLIELLSNFLGLGTLLSQNHCGKVLL